MFRVKLTDEEWERVRHHFPEERKPKGRRGGPRVPTRDVLEAVLWILRTGAEWSWLPQCYPNYDTVRRRFQAWVAAGVVEKVLADLAEPRNLFDGAALGNRGP